MTSKQRVLSTLEFELRKQERIPRNLWQLPWSDIAFPGEYSRIISEYPDDIVKAPELLLKEIPSVEGNPFALGKSVDAWGAIFENTHEGIQGEVKAPIIQSWDDTSAVHFPVEKLSLDMDEINAFCRKTQAFVRAPLCANPFERLQYLRGTENVLIDLALGEVALRDFLTRIHEFNLKVCDAWSQTDVDALFIMDDWGSQQSMLISPKLWREIFKPLYKDYVEIAHRAGKKLFMHSDGNILSIYPDLVEIGVDAINSQIFCIGIDNLKAFKGKITFWGEMDRQHILAGGDQKTIHAAVEKVYHSLFSSGGVIAQCEFGPGARPENIRTVFDSWNRVMDA